MSLAYTPEQHAALDELERLALVCEPTQSNMSVVDAYAEFHRVATPKKVIELIHALRQALGFMAQ